MSCNASTTQDLLDLVSRIHPDFKSVWNERSLTDQTALAAYFLPRSSGQEFLCPTRPRLVKWYCPFAAQCQFPTGHRYCINVFVGCSHCCVYCYAAAYEPDHPTCKRDFQALIDKDMADLDRFDVPPAPVHLSNSTDPFQPLEATSGHTRYALEQILAHRNRFTTVTILTKNPMLPIRTGYVDLFKALCDLPASHSRRTVFQNSGRPAFQMEVSLAFWREDPREAYDPHAPAIQDRKEAIMGLREAGIPIVIRVDPLFPRSPLPCGKSMADFSLTEAQTLDDLEYLAAFAREAGAHHVVYSPVKVVQPRRRKLGTTMAALRDVLRAMSAPGKPVWRGGSWRLPAAIAEEHVNGPFRAICAAAGVKAKFCMTDLVETL